MRFLFRYVCIIIVFFISISAHGLNNQQQTLVNNIQKYLNSIDTLTAKFLQVDVNGDSSTGDLYLLRPGKLRWEYHHPIPILVVVNGSLLTYYDQELKQVSHGSANNNLAGFLARKEITFNKDVTVQDVVVKAGTIKIKITQEANSINLIFNEAPIYLKKMEIFDEMGNITSIILSDVKLGVKLDGALFKANQLKK
jgi:outer membrane lipoprotein-sorting protein